MNSDQLSEKIALRKTKAGIAWVFLGIAGILLLFEDRVHPLRAMPHLPYLLLLACPLLHLFMHRGDGHGGARPAEDKRRAARSRGSPSRIGSAGDRDKDAPAI